MVFQHERAAFVGWAQEVYETYFSHRYTGTDRVAPSNTIYYPKWVPDGYDNTFASPSLVSRYSVADLFPTKVLITYSKLAQLSFQETTAVCFVTISGAGSKYISADISLWNGSTCVKTWERNNTGSIYLKKKND